jgi:hypothetical protein
VDILFHAGNYLFPSWGSAFQTAAADRGQDGEGNRPKTGKASTLCGIDVRSLFNARYKGFAELLRAYARSEQLRFTGGISAAEPAPAGNTGKNRKESP